MTSAASSQVGASSQATWQGRTTPGRRDGPSLLLPHSVTARAGAVGRRRCPGFPGGRCLTEFRGRCRAGPGGAALGVTCNLVQKVSTKELETLLNADERKLPIVIDFYATWCGPCVILAQQLEKLAVEYEGNVQFVKVDTDEEYELANQLEIRGLPTLVFVSKEKEKLAKRTEGILPPETLKELIEDLYQ